MGIKCAYDLPDLRPDRILPRLAMPSLVLQVPQPDCASQVREVADALWKALPLFLRRGLPQHIRVEVRLSLCRWLALGPEFAFAQHILRTAAVPTWRDIGQFAAIDVLLTGLSYSLELEIAREGAFWF